MGSSGEKSYTNWPSRTRSGKDYRGVLRLSGDTKEKNGADLMPQHTMQSIDSLISVDEFQTQADTLEGGTQVLDDFTDGFSSELVDTICETQVLEDTEDTCHTLGGSLEGEQQVPNEHKDENGTGLEDMEGDTQILDDPEDMFQKQSPNFGTHTEVNENGTFEENLYTQILDDHSQQLCTEGLVSISNGRITASNSGRSSSRETDHCKSSSDCITDGTVDHTSGYVPPRFTEIQIESLRASAAAAQSRLEKKNLELNCSSITSQSSQKHEEKDSDKSGYMPLRFTEIRVESWIASGLAAKNRALRGNTAGAFCSVNTSPVKQGHIDRVNENSVKGSPSSVEGTDDDEYAAFREPKDRDFRKGRKVKNSAVRKLFAEEVVSKTEAFGTIVTGNNEYELPSGEGDIDAVGLSYVDSQEPNDLAQAKALDFVEKFLTANLVDIDTTDRGGSRVKHTNAIAHSSCKQSLVKKSILRSDVEFSKAFDWDDNIEDEGGGAFFCKLKEKSFKKESDFRKSAPPIQKSNPFDSEQLENVREQLKAIGKKRKLYDSDTGMVSQITERTVKNFEGNAKRNILNVWNQEPSTGNNASHQTTPDMPIAGKDASDGTSAVRVSHAGRDNYQLNNIEKGASEGISVGRTRKRSFIKEHNLRKRARPSSDKVSENFVQSMQIPNRRMEGTSQDAPTRIQDAKFIEQPIENPALAGTKIRSGDGRVPKFVTSKGDSSSIDAGQIGLVEQIKPSLSKAKASSRTIHDEVRRTLSNKRAIPRRSCRLNKVTELEDSCKQQVNQGSNDCTLEHSRLINGAEAMHLLLQADASPNGLASECSLKRPTERSMSSKEQENMERAFPIRELTSGKYEQFIISNGATQDLKINGPKSRHEYKDKGSYRNIKNQGGNSETMTCTRRTRASMRNGLNPAETLQDLVKPIEQPAYIFHAKRTRSTSPVGHDPIEVSSTYRFFKVIKDQICQVQPVEEHCVQSKPTSSENIVEDPGNISSNRKGIPLRRSRRLNGSSTLNDLSLHNVSKQTNAGATEEQHLHTEFATPMEDAAPKLEISPRGRTCNPFMESVTPTNSMKPSEEASPICMGNEYYKISCNQNLSRSDLKEEINNLITCSQDMKSGLKDSKKRRVMADVRVLFSRHLGEDTLKRQKKILNRLGASEASSISDATHFITDEFVRTKNMLEAIALGKPVVTPLWLVSCCGTRLHIDEKNYILRDEKKEKEFGFSMPVSLDLARRQPLLQKRRVLITPNTKPGKEVIACLVKAVCGQVIGRIGRSALRDNNLVDGILILTCEEDFAICEPFLEKGAKVYSSELLLNGIVTQRLEYERMVIL